MSEEIDTLYGIDYCKKVINGLEEAEEKMFEEKGHGFDIFSQEFLTLKRYTRYLKRFEKEKDMGLKPTYDPEYHGEGL